MTASNPTPDDLRTIATNLYAEGHYSRADVIMNAAKRMDRLELYLSQFRAFAGEIANEMDSNVNRLREYFDIEGGDK